jgi:hypothetical protein
VKSFPCLKNPSKRRLLALLLFTGLPAFAQPHPNSDTADFILADFNGSASTFFGGATFPFTDNNTATQIDTVFGNSVLTAFGSLTESAFDSLGNLNPMVYPLGHSGDSTDRALRFGFILGDRNLSCGASCEYPGYVGFTTSLRSFDTLDMSGSAGLAFWAKADSTSLTFNVSVATRDTTTGAAEYAQSFTVDTAWKLCVIKLEASADFAQPSWSPAKPFVASLATGIAIGVNAGDNAARPANALWIDNLMLQKWKYVEPIIVDLPTGGLLAHSKRQDLRFGLIRTGNGLRVRLPSLYGGKSGRVQAIDMSGRVIGEVPFQASSTEVEFASPSQSYATGGIHFRVLTSRSQP